MVNDLPDDCVVGREIIDSLLSSLIARLYSNAYGEIVTSYLLSVKGKNEVRGMLCSQDTPAKSRLQAMLELSRAMSDSPEYFHLCRMSGDDTDDTDSDCSEEIPPERDGAARDHNYTGKKACLQYEFRSNRSRHARRKAQF